MEPDRSHSAPAGPEERAGDAETEAAEELRSVMEQLKRELARMEDNLQALIRLSGENESEGGTDNGSH